MKILEKNSTTFGFIISTALPLILLLTVYLLKFRSYGYAEICYIPQIGKNIPKIVSLCVFPNGLIFYVYIIKNRLKTMRGMLGGTVIWALITGVLFFIL
jgi:hypothetical protein